MQAAVLPKIKHTATTSALPVPESRLNLSLHELLDHSFNSRNEKKTKASKRLYFLLLEPQKFNPKMLLRGNHGSKWAANGMGRHLVVQWSSSTVSGDNFLLLSESFRMSAWYAFSTAMVCKNTTSLARRHLPLAHKMWSKLAWLWGQNRGLPCCTRWAVTSEFCYCSRQSRLECNGVDQQNLHKMFPVAATDYTALFRLCHCM